MSYELRLLGILHVNEERNRVQTLRPLYNLDICLKNSISSLHLTPLAHDYSKENKLPPLPTCQELFVSESEVEEPLKQSLIKLAEEITFSLGSRGFEST